MKLLIEGNEFIGEPPAPAKTWGEYFENVVTTSRLSGLRVSALAEDGHETNFGIMSQVIDSSWVGHMRLAERVPARGTLLKRNTMKFFDRVYAEKTSQESRQVEPVAWTPRELELIDGMIEVQLNHAERCDHIANRTMAEKQKGWNMERVALLRKIRDTTPKPPKREPLTIHQLNGIEMRMRVYFDEDRYDLSLHDFARAIERAHGIGGEE